MLHNLINGVIIGGVRGRWWLTKATETVLGFAYANKYANEPKTTPKQSQNVSELF